MSKVPFRKGVSERSHTTHILPENKQPSDQLVVREIERSQRPHVLDIRSQENCIFSLQTLAAEIQFGLVHGQSAQGLQDWLGLLDLYELLGLLNRDVVLEQIYAGQRLAVIDVQDVPDVPGVRRLTCRYTRKRR